MNTNQLLSNLKSKFGRKYKTLLRDAWVSGNYSKLGVTAEEKAQLQFLRNQGYRLNNV